MQARKDKEEGELKVIFISNHIIMLAWLLFNESFVGIRCNEVVEANLKVRLRQN